MSLSKAFRDSVWMRDHETVKAICPCCNINEMTINTCQCGHIISVKNGGTDDSSNLKSICQQCNSDMGRKNMDDWLKEKYPSEEEKEKQQIKELEDEIKELEESINENKTQIFLIKNKKKSEENLNKLLKIENKKDIDKNFISKYGISIVSALGDSWDSNSGGSKYCAIYKKDWKDRFPQEGCSLPIFHYELYIHKNKTMSIEFHEEREENEENKNIFRDELNKTKIKEVVVFNFDKKRTLYKKMVSSEIAEHEMIDFINKTKSYISEALNNYETKL